MRLIHRPISRWAPALFAIALSPAAFAQETAKPEPVAFSISNDRLKLEVDLTLSNGHCRLTDKKTGEVYAARDFGVIRAYDVTEDRFRTALISPEFEPSLVQVSVAEKAADRVRLHVDTGEGSASAMGRMSFGVEFDIDLVLNGDHLEMSIPSGSLQEHLTSRWRLMSVELMPHLGMTPRGAAGYIIIPSWSGAVYYFDRDHSRANPAYAKPNYGDLGTPAGIESRWSFNPQAPAQYGSMMYGIQASWEDQLQLPVYATMRANGGLAAILLSGEYDTEVVARRDQGPEHTCSVNALWHYRKLWHSRLDPVDRRVRLIALDKERATYVGLGNLYRDFLVHELKVPTLKQRAADNPEVAYFIDSVYLRVYMGNREARLDGSGKMRSRMSWDEFAASVPLFQKAGFEKCNFIFVGANFGGHDGAHPTVFPLEPAHGGDDAFKKMMATITAAGYRATFHLNYKDTYECSPDWTPQAVQMGEFGELRKHGAWIGGYSYQGIPQEMLERFGKRDLPKLRELGLRGMHYWDACLSVMEETFPPNRVITRREYGEGAMAYFKYAASIFGTVGCETTVAPLLGIIVNAGNTNYPNGGASVKYPSNGYCEAALIDHWVPLEHIVYHGMCCYGGNGEIAGRTGYEFNNAPTVEQVNMIRERWVQHQQWGGQHELAFIVDHQWLRPGVTRTTLSDGLRIWVNHSKAPWSGDGVTVQPGEQLVR